MSAQKGLSDLRSKKALEKINVHRRLGKRTNRQNEIKDEKRQKPVPRRLGTGSAVSAVGAAVVVAVAVEGGCR